MIVYGANEAVAAFVARTIPGCERGFGNCTAIGFTRDDVLVAGVVYHNWNPEAQVIELSSGSIVRNWTTKAVIRAIFEYPFDQLDCQMVVARISEFNNRARRIWRALGATETIIPRLRGRNEAEVISTLTVEAWRAGKFGGKNG